MITENLIGTFCRPITFYIEKVSDRFTNVKGSSLFIVIVCQKTAVQDIAIIQILKCAMSAKHM